MNIRFLWELEEEIGSPHFAATLKTMKEAARTDSVVVSDTVWVSRGKPSISSGLRGLQRFTFHLETAATDQHSGTTGGAARNPVAELCQLAAEMHDARTGRVKIPGFYEDVAPLIAQGGPGLQGLRLQRLALHEGPRLPLHPHQGSRSR